MPDHSPHDDDEEPHGPAVAHDDIMKRLLDYQRQMREGEEPEASHASFDDPPRPATDFLEAPLGGTHVDSETFERAVTSSDEGIDAPSFDAGARPADEPSHAETEGLGHWSDEELEQPPSARAAEAREPDVAATPEVEAAPQPHEESPPPARRGFFRSRGSRREEADVPSLEAATNLADVPDFEDVAPALTGSVAAELEARIAGFERTLQRLHGQVSELRQAFADMAVAADERLGALEDEIAKARAERFS
jgi:hypothetical protein